jgi:hypothetical protein
MVAHPASSIKRRSYWVGTKPLTPPLLERFPAKWTRFALRKRVKIRNLEPRFDSIETEKALGRTRQPSLRSTSDPIDSRFPLNATQWCVELFDVVARQQLANGGSRIESFRETDLVRVGE